MCLYRIPDSTANDVIMSDVSAAQMCLVALLQWLRQLRLFLVQHSPIALCASLSALSFLSQTLANEGRAPLKMEKSVSMDRARGPPAAVVDEVVSPRTRRKECSRRAITTRVEEALETIVLEKSFAPSTPKNPLFGPWETHLVPIAGQVKLSPRFPLAVHRRGPLHLKIFFWTLPRTLPHAIVLSLAFILVYTGNSYIYTSRLYFFKPSRCLSHSQFLSRWGLPFCPTWRPSRR